jgi:hypothetical protein
LGCTSTPLTNRFKLLLVRRGKLVELIWNKPVLTFYREKYKQHKREPFAVVKAKKLSVSKPEEGRFCGSIQDFFPLMGNLDCISTVEGMDDKYVVCWFDDNEDDLNKAFRRLTGVAFPSGAPYVINEKGKRTYNTTFEAEHGKLE